MTAVQELLDAATPLPWAVHSHDWGDGTTYSVNGAPVVANEADARLIVHAVNHMADCEAVAGALERFLFVTVMRPPDHDELEAAIAAGRAALRRLRGDE